MIKNTPTNRLPFIKSNTPVNKEASIEDVSDALSTVKQETVQITGNIFGLISTTASYYDYLTSRRNLHNNSITSAWKNRKST